jgi:uncharacterized protein
MDRSAVELSTDECWELLATSTLGRLALSIHALPIILPVRYVVDDASVTISLDRLGMPDAAVDNSVVAFAVDEISPVSDEGWWVQMQGIARLTAPTGAPGAVDSTRIVRVVPQRMTGLRFSIAPTRSAH